MSRRTRLALVYGLLGVLTAACTSPSAQLPAPTPTQAAMAPMAGPAGSVDYAPLVKGLYEGEEVLFIHTEASDPNVVQMLTMMMGPRVVLVAELRQVPASALAEVYVFTNGVNGEGPFGYQPDVFDAVPGDEAYRPLRSVNLVQWAEGKDARELRSVADIAAAQVDGEVIIEAPGIVVNMPILAWPGGHR